jgi:SnoaL-like domain
MASRAIRFCVSTPPEEEKGQIIMSLPLAVCDAADVSAVTQLILRERDSRDLGRWDEMRTCYHPDAQVRVSWFHGSATDFIKGSIDMASRMVNRHRLSPIRVELSDKRAFASFAAIVEIPTKLHEIEMVLLIYARFIYRAEKRNNQWKVVHFDSVYLRDELTAAIPGRFVSIDPHELKEFRTSYRLLSYVLSQHGYTIRSDLPGEDRPETVQALMREVFTWAGTNVG